MKRGESGLSLVLGMAKPSGMTSHDVVGRVRRALGERRVGHTGTLDPLASGVLPVCVGSATRLSPYLTAEDKRYEVAVAFGAATDTDDAEGEVIRTGEVPARLYDEAFAARFVAGLVGPSRQLPPVYSAIKVNGRKACDEARRGNVIAIEPRDIEVYGAKLLSIDEEGPGGGLRWSVAFHVSKGTYIRALARDMGRDLGYLDEAAERAVSNGAPLPADALALCERSRRSALAELCACTSGVMDSPTAPEAGERVALIARNRLLALYELDQQAARFKPCCVFQGGISRGAGA